MAAENTGNAQLTCDLLVIGSGVAGMMTALEAAKYCRVILATKDVSEEGSTRYAQGGIAFAIGDRDSTELHLQDTLTAGAGLCDRAAVDLLVNEGVDCFLDLVSLGARFDHSGEEVRLHREGGHSRARIVHAGDATGWEIVRTLTPLVRKHENITILEHCFLDDLLTEDGRCRGGRFTTGATTLTIDAQATVLSSGGAGQLFRLTTNPPVSTGDGIVAAARAGARVADLEFIQFHPTALYGEENPLFLISEAVRGEGALLVDARGDRFMLGAHPQAELAPRDVVVRAMYHRMRELGTDHVYLDLRPIPRAKLEKEFPTIYDRLKDRNIDIHRHLVPISFAAHYTIGGVVTDLEGRTSLPDLYACGEVSCTGVHGANRLASNSLLEALVFSRRITRHAAGMTPRGGTQGAVPKMVPARPDAEAMALHKRFAASMMDLAGVFRSAQGLEAMRAELPLFRNEAEKLRPGIPQREMLNMLELADLLTASALARTESRGVHQREDHPHSLDIWAQKHVVFEHGRQRIAEQRAEGILW